MSPQTNRIILIGMIAGTLLGALAGAVIPQVMLLFGIVGRLFLNALNVLLLPLIPAIIIVGVAGLGHAPRFGRAALSTVLYFIATTTVAALIGIVLVLVFQPGGGVPPDGAFIPDMVNRARAANLGEIFTAFIPDTFIGALGAGQYLGLVVLALVFGAVICTMGAAARAVVDFFKGLSDITLRAASYLMYAAPIGLFFLVGAAVARNPQSLASVSGNLVLLTVTFVLAILLQGLVVLPLMLRSLGKRNPIEYAGKTAPAMMTALGTASSAAALPVTYRTVVDDSEVDARAGSLVLPLGATLNANGTAIYLVIASVFTAQMFSVPLTVIDVVAIALLSVLLSMLTAGAPNMSLFVLAIIFAAVNYPVEAYGVIGLLSVVDWLFGRGRAVLNVWGDIVGAAVIGESFEFKTARVTPAVAESAPYRRDRTPGRRDRRPGETDTRRGPRDADQRDRGRGRGRTSDRPPRADRPAAERPVRPAPESKPIEPRRETPAPAAAPARQDSRRPESARPPRRNGDRGERPPRPDRPPRTGRPAVTPPPEPRPEPARQQTAPETLPERPRLVPPPIPPRPAPEIRPPEPLAVAPRVEPEAPAPAFPEIKRRPLPSEIEPKIAGEEPEIRPAEDITPEPAPESPRAQLSFEDRWRNPERDRDESFAAHDDDLPTPEQFEEHEEPNLRDLLAGLPAARDNRGPEDEAPEPAGEEPDSTPTEEPATDQPISYGRSRSRRGAHTGGKPTEGDQPESPTEGQPETPVERPEEFSVDSVSSFGRSRRRRPSR